MHRIGDKILYGTSGVMTVVDIREESVGDLARSYYILAPISNFSGSLTYVPVDNEKLVSCMRCLLTKEEILDILQRAKDYPDIDWIPENRARSESFRVIMESGDRAKMLAMIRAIDEQGLLRVAEGKKNFISDENARQKAERLLFTEISVVMGITEDEARVLVNSNTK